MLFSRSDGFRLAITENGFVKILNDYNHLLFLVQVENLAIFFNEELICDDSNLEFWGEDNFIIYPERHGVSLSYAILDSGIWMEINP